MLCESLSIIFVQILISKITFMETYGKILMVASPAFLLLVLGEKLYAWFYKKEPFRNMDMISSLSSGYTNSIKDVLGIGVSILTYKWMVEHWAVFKIESSLIVGIIAFISLDLAGYLGHRLNHQVNFLWNQHLIHHSSEEFNLACALRQSISSLVNFFTIFLLPAAIFGVPAQIIAIIAPIHLFAQFWYHTVHIGRMGFLEQIIVTPSHHRVHHAINPEYIDKNHGQIFIIWDKLFGTFQEELPNVPPVYGITVAVSTWNPIKINFQHIWLLIQDAWRTKNWKDKFTIWFKPTGWRPADVIEQYPLHNKITNPYNFQKYNPLASNALIIWTWIQFVSTFGLLLFFYGNIAKFGVPNMFIYGGFLMLSIYAYSELMDRNPNAIWWELIKNICGFALIFQMGNWFVGNQTQTILVMIYLVVSMVGTAYFVLREFQSSKLMQTT
jgi:alkylglycerol monooxygenase